MIEHDRPLDDGQNFVLTTKQVAEHFGLSQETIRSIKSKNSDRLIEGVHWTNFEGRCCWTESAIAVIESIRNGDNGSVDDSEATAESTDIQALTADNGSVEPLTLDSLADDFENALRPHARKVARHEAAQHFRRLVEEEKILEYQRLIEAATRGDDESLYGFADPLYVVGAIASRNGHKALTGGNHA